MTWSKRYLCCRYCRTVEIKHKGRGLCTFCHREIWRYITGPKKKDDMAPFFKKIYYDHIGYWNSKKVIKGKK